MKRESSSKRGVGSGFEFSSKSQGSSLDANVPAAAPRHGSRRSLSSKQKHHHNHKTTGRSTYLRLICPCVVFGSFGVVAWMTLRTISRSLSKGQRSTSSQGQATVFYSGFGYRDRSGLSLRGNNWNMPDVLRPPWQPDPRTQSDPDYSGQESSPSDQPEEPEPDRFPPAFAGAEESGDGAGRVETEGSGPGAGEEEEEEEEGQGKVVIMPPAVDNGSSNRWHGTSGDDAPKRRKKANAFVKRGKGNWQGGVGFEEGEVHGAKGMAHYSLVDWVTQDEPGPAQIVNVDERPSENRPARVLGYETVLLIICADRAEYLDRTLKAVEKYHPKNDKGEAFTMPVVISQDGSSASAEKVIKAFQQAMTGRARVVHIKHRQDRHAPNNYFRLADHYHYALDKVFDTLDHSGYNAILIDNVIVLEEDLEIAPDFFDYFAATAPLLDSDESLMAVSAWNDNGQAGAVKDNTAIHRTDFFPGLGWMLPRRVWDELSGKWPKAYWDDWMREPEQRNGRQFLRPEVCRTYHFGKKGTSNNQFGSHLDNIKLNDEPVRFREMDLSYLEPEPFRNTFVAQVQAAPRMSVYQVANLVGGVTAAPATVRIDYNGRAQFEAVAQKLGVMQDLKAGIPRTAYMGVVSFWRGNTKVFVTPHDFGR